MLRAAANPPGVSTQDLIAELNADPRLPRHLKDSITREFMNQHIANTSPAETKTAADIAVELSFQRGVEKGMSEALAALTPVARALPTPDELAALGASPTFDAVQAALRGRVLGQ